MDKYKQERLKKLKNKNNKRLETLKIKNNVLLNEAIETLGENIVVLNEDESKLIYKKFVEVIPFTANGVEFNKLKSYKCIERTIDLQIDENNFYYIIWSSNLPIIKSDFNNILKSIDDVSAVEADTWLVSDKFDIVIEPELSN